MSREYYKFGREREESDTIDMDEGKRGELRIQHK